MFEREKGSHKKDHYEKCRCGSTWDQVYPFYTDQGIWIACTPKDLKVRVSGWRTKQNFMRRAIIKKRPWDGSLFIREEGTKTR